MTVEHRCGVYVIEQLGTGRYYIGSSKSVRNRWFQHRKLLVLGKHHSAFLQHSWTKYGPDAFRFWIIEECTTRLLLEREQYYLDALKPVFNVCPKARSRLGSKHRPEVREYLAGKIRARQNAKTHCPRGHEYSPGNTAISVRGARLCRTCNRLRAAAIIAAETLEQRAKRLRRMRLRPRNRQKVHEYTLRTKDRKREYDRMYRLRKVI